MCKIIQKIILTGNSKFISEVQTPSRTGNFALFRSSEGQPNSREMGTREVKWLGVRPTTHSLPSSVKVENDWSYASVFTVCLYGVYGDNVTFTCTTVYSLWGVTRARS
jgi:hypothetical protein